jgi:hypothetical protein
VYRAVAIRRGQNAGQASDFRETGVLRCDGCGEEFLIHHHPDFADPSVAAKQAYWLEKVLAEEHEREKKHANRIELPELTRDS